MALYVRTHPCGARSAKASLVLLEQTPYQASKGRHFTLFTVKLVRRTKCHQNTSKRPPIVPIFKTGSESHLLIFPGFPFRLAFSHKELMVPFEASLRLYCQNDEVSTDGTPSDVTRRGAQIPPRTSQQAASDVRSSSEPSAVFSTDQFQSVLHLIMTETVFWDPLRIEACGRSI